VLEDIVSRPGDRVQFRFELEALPGGQDPDVRLTRLLRHARNLGFKVLRIGAIKHRSCVHPGPDERGTS
jgi:hypothetical protein